MRRPALRVRRASTGTTWDTTRPDGECGPLPRPRFLAASTPWDRRVELFARRSDARVHVDVRARLDLDAKTLVCCLADRPDPPEDLFVAEPARVRDPEDLPAEVGLPAEDGDVLVGTASKNASGSSRTASKRQFVAIDLRRGTLPIV